VTQLATRGKEAALRMEADGPGLDGTRVDGRPKQALRLEVPHSQPSVEGAHHAVLAITSAYSETSCISSSA
jgi:hypothetical protein